MTPSPPRLTAQRIRHVGYLGLQLRFWVATSVTALAFYCQEALNREGVIAHPLERTPLTTWGIVFLSTLALYNLDGSLDAAPGARRARLHWALTIGSSILLLPLLLTLPLQAAALAAAGLLLCGLYAVPWGPAPQSRRLKSVPGLKAPFIGSAVAVAVVYFPALTRAPGHFAPSLLSIESLRLTLPVACLCTVNAILFDIPDQVADRKEQIPTLPARWGTASALGLCRAMSLSAGLLVVALLREWQPLACLALALMVACSRIDTKTSKSAVAFWVDGALMLPTLVLLLLTRC